MERIFLSNGATFADYSDNPDIMDELKKNDPNFNIDLPCIYRSLIYTKKARMLKFYFESNPYHIFIYRISCLYFLEENQKIVFYCPKGPKLVEELIENLPEKFVRISEFNPDLEYIHLPALQWGHDFVKEKWACQYVRDFFKHIWEPVQIDNKFIFISRNHSSNTSRRILNEEKLLPLLELYNIKVYHLETMTFVEQIQLFRSAKLIIGPHGAGLAWILFCNPAAKIVEIANTLDKQGHYRNICNHLKLSYTQYSEVEWDSNNMIFDPYKFNFFLEHHLMPFL